jgi:hypothetical protein
LILLISASGVASITGVSHQHLAIKHVCCMKTDNYLHQNKSNLILALLLLEPLSRRPGSGSEHGPELRENNIIYMGK